jgi:uncharacterized protein YkwD
MAADHPRMAAGGGRTLIAIACAVSLTAVAAPVAASSSSSHRTARVASASLESGLLQQLNAVRTDHGLAALRGSPRLAAAAAQHAREMATGGYFDHSSADGTSFAERIAHWYPSDGYSRWSVGENLLWSSPSVDSSGAVELWMHSAPHRANILDARWREIGIAAIHVATAGGTFGRRPVTIVTTDFGFRR